MSSHREAPEISKDPVADNTDVYAFVSPDQPRHRHDHRQLHPARGPGGRPELLRVRRRRPLLDPHRQRRRRPPGHHVPVPVPDARSATRRRSSTTPARSARSTTRTGTGGSSTRSRAWTARHRGTVHRARSRLAAVQHRPALDAELHRARAGRRPHVAERRDRVRRAAERRLLRRPGCDLRPRRPAAVPEPPPAPDAGDAGVDTLSTLNVHSIAIQVPIAGLTRDRSVPSDPSSPKAVIGVWAGASRRAIRMSDGRKGARGGSGPWVQVSRLGNPLFNEVIMPMGRKDEWNASDPSDDGSFASYVAAPGAREPAARALPAACSRTSRA